MPNYCLSICIPTFNRPEALRQCLESITSQFNRPDLAEKVEIVISDNASEGETQSVVFEFRQKFPNINYSRNSENLGFDRNLLKVVEMAKGDYCWLMGDDDALFENALENLLPLLEAGKYDYLMANAWGYDHELRQPAVSRPNLSFAQDRIYKALKDFVPQIPNYRDMVGYFAGMSCQIFRRQVWMDFPGKEKFVGSQTIHFHIILLAFKNLPACVLATPLVKTRADNIRWETFPGLESVGKRARSTREGVVWVLNLYNIPYSKIKLYSEFFFRQIYSYLQVIAKKYIFKSKKSREMVKKFLGR